MCDRTPRKWSISSKKNKALICEDVGDDGLTEYEWRVQRPAKKGEFNLDVQNRVADEVSSRCRIYFPLRETVQQSKGGMDVSASQFGPGEADEVRELGPSAFNQNSGLLVPFRERLCGIVKAKERAC